MPPYRLSIALAVLAFASPMPAQAAAPTSAPPASNVMLNGAPAPADLPPNTLMEDASGKPIDKAAFDAGLRHGQRYASSIDNQADAIVLRLLPKGEQHPGSFAPTDMHHMTFSFMVVNGVHYIIELHDTHGQRIDTAAFTAGAAQGQRYQITFDQKNRVAFLTLLPLGAKPTGSQPTAMFTARVPTDGPAVPKPGTAMPAFDLPNVGGDCIDNASLQGKPYVVDFFFAECVGCIAELPVLNAYRKAHPQQRVFAVTFDDADTAATFVKQRHFDWPVAYAGQKFLDGLGVKVYPTMSVVGADGKVLATRVGADATLTPAALAQWVAASLVAKPTPTAQH